MGRPKGSKNKPKDPDAGIGHNSDAQHLTDEQRRSLTMEAADNISRYKEEMAALRSDMTAIYADCKAKGLPKKDIDALIALRAMSTDEVVAKEKHRAQLIEWAHPGVQAELFGFLEAAQ